MFYGRNITAIFYTLQLGGDVLFPGPPMTLYMWVELQHMQANNNSNNIVIHQTIPLSNHGLEFKILKQIGEPASFTSSFTHLLCDDDV